MTEPTSTMVYKASHTISINFGGKESTPEETVQIKSFMGLSDAKGTFYWSFDAARAIKVGLRWSNIGLLGAGTGMSFKLVRDPDGFVFGTSPVVDRFPLNTSGESSFTVPIVSTSGLGMNKCKILLEMSMIEPLSSGSTVLRVVQYTGAFRALLRRIFTPPAAIDSSQSPNNVRLVFPNSLELWTTTRALSHYAYFQRLFSAGFSESSESTGKRSAPETGLEAKRDFDDSDDESDELIVDLKLKAKNTTPSTVPAIKSSSEGKDPKEEKIEQRLPFHQIKIDSVAYTTYRAFLCWVHTSYIEFAPLLSSFRLDADPVASRKEAISKQARKAHLPRPTSPKSMYRLAHFLDIPELMELSLASLESQLTVETVAFEAFSDVAVAYDAVREIEMSYMIKNWEKVMASAGMAAVERLVAGGKLPKSSTTALKLLKLLKA